MLYGKFIYFGPDHLLALGGIAGIALVLALLVRHPRFRHWQRPACEILFLTILTAEVTKYLNWFHDGVLDIKTSLPLHICNVGTYLCACALVKNNRYVWELAYFWVLSGTLPSLATPFITKTFPSYEFMAFFISHGSLVIAVVFLAAACGRVITKDALWRVWIVTNVYAVCIFFLNKAIGANYLFIAHKPEMYSLLDYCGPWPVYLLWLEALFTASLFIFYLPFRINGKS